MNDPVTVASQCVFHDSISLGAAKPALDKWTDTPSLKPLPIIGYGVRSSHDTDGVSLCFRRAVFFER